MLSAFAFISAKLFPILLQNIDLHGTMLIYGICCMAAAIFVAFVMKETSGKSLEGIDNDLSNDISTNKCVFTVQSYTSEK